MISLCTCVCAIFRVFASVYAVRIVLALRHLVMYDAQVTITVILLGSMYVTPRVPVYVLYMYCNSA